MKLQRMAEIKKAPSSPYGESGASLDDFIGGSS
jgi:hypothetical protein